MSSATAMFSGRAPFTRVESPKRENWWPLLRLRWGLGNQLHGWLHSRSIPVYSATHLEEREMAGVELKELQRDSGRKLPVSVIHGLTGMRSGLQIQLTLGSGKWVAKLSAASGNRIKSDQKLKTLEAEREGGYTTLLNDALQGASDYPVLNAVLGTAVGVGTGGASLLFTIAT